MSQTLKRGDRVRTRLSDAHPQLSPTLIDRTGTVLGDYYVLNEEVGYTVLLDGDSEDRHFYESELSYGDGAEL